MLLLLVLDGGGGGMDFGTILFTIKAYISPVFVYGIICPFCLGGFV